MKTRKEILDEYKKWMKTGKMTRNTGSGLCYSTIGVLTPNFDRISPTKSDFLAFADSNESTLFWGAGNLQGLRFGGIASGFTPLRQNLVLLLAEIVEEE